MPDINPIGVSQQLLLQAKTHEPTFEQMVSFNV